MSIEDLIAEIERRGWEIVLDGPKRHAIVPRFRWTLRCFTSACDMFGVPVDRKMFRGETPADVLTQALAWQPKEATE